LHLFFVYLFILLCLFPQNHESMRSHTEEEQELFLEREEIDDDFVSLLQNASTKQLEVLLSLFVYL
jgi:hypothetical protein